jgi:hypothetical protein
MRASADRRHRRPLLGERASAWPPPAGRRRRPLCRRSSRRPRAGRRDERNRPSQGGRGTPLGGSEPERGPAFGEFSASGRRCGSVLVPRRRGYRGGHRRDPCLLSRERAITPEASSRTGSRGRGQAVSAPSSTARSRRGSGGRCGQIAVSTTRGSSSAGSCSSKRASVSPTSVAAGAITP